MNEDYDLNDYYDIPNDSQLNYKPVMAGSKSPNRRSRSPTRKGRRQKSASPRKKRSTSHQQRGYSDPISSHFLFPPQQQRQQVNFQARHLMPEPTSVCHKLSDCISPHGQKHTLKYVVDIATTLRPICQAISSAVLFLMICFFMLLLIMEIFTSNIIFRTSVNCR